MAKEKTLSEEWEDAPRNEKSLERHLKEEFPSKKFKVTWNPFNIHVDGNNTDTELVAIQKSAERWHYACFGTGIVWGTPTKS